MRRADLSPSPAASAATAKLAASRLRSAVKSTSGSVSSKSLMSNSALPSGDKKAPKFIKWQSPHACVFMPGLGCLARSNAIRAAAPRRKANGDCDMRSRRIGTSAGSRPLLVSSKMAMGSRSPILHSARFSRETASRSFLPAPKRSSNGRRCSAVTDGSSCFVKALSNNQNVFRLGGYCFGIRKRVKRNQEEQL